MFGTLFVPLAVQAGFLTSLFVDEVHAENPFYDSMFKGFGGGNSQTISLLQSNISSASIMEEAKGKVGNGDKETSTLEGEVVVADNALVPSVGPLSGTGGAALIEDVSAEDISVYVIRKNDSLSEIAEMYDVSVNTILWANDMKKGDKLVEGELLLILPVSGIKHTVVKGQTLKGIANKYKVDADTIARFNGISVGDQLALGEELLIPEGEMPNDDTPAKKSVGTPKVKVAKNGSSKVLSGYFINPVPELKRKSQGIHGKNGVDLAAPTGTRILASGPGTVLIARNGYNGGYGNMVTIQHSNGTKTLYAHMSTIATKTGAKVNRGQVIGYVGSTGRSTGPHLHFEVYNAKNPGGDWTWAKQ